MKNISMPTAYHNVPGSLHYQSCLSYEGYKRYGMLSKTGKHKMRLRKSQERRKKGEKSDKISPNLLPVHSK